MKASISLVIMLLSLSFMGCLEPDDKRTIIEESDLEVTRLVVSEEELSQFPYTLDPIRNFSVVDPASMDIATERLWAVYGTEDIGGGSEHNYGGNCCEHYLATDQDGVIYNLGGEWPWWSTDRGLTWTEWVPPAVNTDLGCEEGQFDPTVAPGLGEGSIIQAPNGDIIAMTWFPYPSVDGVDQFYAILGKKTSSTEIEWEWCWNSADKEPFYDRSWQVPVVGPINPPAEYATNKCSSNCPWASMVVSNFWSYNEQGYQISVDGLNYRPIQIPDSNAGGPADLEFDLYFEDLGPEWDYMQPHREMRASPIPSGGLLFPRWYSDGSNLFLDTNLEWHKHTLPGGKLLPSRNLVIDSSGALHSVSCNQASPGSKGCDGTFNLTHQISYDGGYNWTNYTHRWPGSLPVSDNTFEWDFQADGNLDLAVISVRVQTENNGTASDADLVFHIRDYRESMEADSITMIGLGDLDATSGAGNDVRFDFSSLAILPDGGVVVAYHDSTDPNTDPMFAIELELPEDYFYFIQG